MVLYTDEVLDNLHDDPKIAVYQLTQIFLKAPQPKSNAPKGPIPNRAYCLEAKAILETYAEAMGITDFDLPDIDDPNFQTDTYIAIKNLHDRGRSHFQFVNETEQLSAFKSKFASKIEKAFVYEFSDDDYERM